MKQVFLATDPTEAQVVRSLLDARGIEAEVHGEALWGAFAAVPMTVDTPPTVWVLDDADEIEALKIIEEYAVASQPPAAPAGTWKCAACGEELEPQFDECWKCGERRSGQ